MFSVRLGKHFHCRCNGLLSHHRVTNVAAVKSAKHSSHDHSHRQPFVRTHSFADVGAHVSTIRASFIGAVLVAHFHTHNFSHLCPIIKAFNFTDSDPDQIALHRAVAYAIADAFCHTDPAANINANITANPKSHGASEHEADWDSILCSNEVTNGSSLVKTVCCPISGPHSKTVGLSIRKADIKSITSPHHKAVLKANAVADDIPNSAANNSAYLRTNIPPNDESNSVSVHHSSIDQANNDSNTIADNF